MNNSLTNRLNFNKRNKFCIDSHDINKSPVTSGSHKQFSFDAKEFDLDYSEADKMIPGCFVFQSGALQSGALQSGSNFYMGI